MKNNILVETMNGKEVSNYNLLMNQITSGTIEFKNIEGNEGYVVLEIVGSSEKTHVKKEDGKDILVKNIDIKASIGETQSKFLINKEVVKEIKKINEIKIEEELLETFNKFKSKDLDICQGKRMLEMKYQNNIEDNYLENLELEVKVNIIIEGTSLIKDTL